MRYAVTTSFYINAESDEEAKAKAKHRAARQDTKNDDGCSVDEIRKAEFGCLIRKIIYSRKEKATAETVA